MTERAGLLPLPPAPSSTRRWPFFPEAALVRARAVEGRGAVLGPATGSTPLNFYAELVRMHREEGLSFANVTTFNLDEYCPPPETHPRSCRRFMQAALFDHVDIPSGQDHVPDGAAGPVLAEDRSRRLAETCNALGLAGYEAIEAFRRCSPEEFPRDAPV